MRIFCAFTPLHGAATRGLKTDVAAFLREMTKAFDDKVWPALTEDVEMATTEELERLGYSDSRERERMRGRQQGRYQSRAARSGVTMDEVSRWAWILVLWKGRSHEGNMHFCDRPCNVFDMINYSLF